MLVSQESHRSLSELCCQLAYAMDALLPMSDFAEEDDIRSVNALTNRVYDSSVCACFCVPVKPVGHDNGVADRELKLVHEC